MRWDEDKNGELWLDNPQFVTALFNPRKVRKMAKPRKGVMPAGLRKYWAKHRRKTKTNPHKRRHYTARAKAPARRRYYAKTNPPRHYKRNKSRAGGGVAKMLGFSIPRPSSIVAAGAGLLFPPMIANYAITNFLPASLQGNQLATGAVKVGSVLIPGLVIGKFVSREAGMLFTLAGTAAFVVELIRSSGVLASVGLQGMGYYPAAMPQLRAVGMGKYITGKTGSRPTTVPRLNSLERFRR